MWLATGGWVAERWLVASHRSPVTSHQEFSHQVASHQNGWWLVAGGSWLVAGSWWLVACGLSFINEIALKMSRNKKMLI